MKRSRVAILGLNHYHVTGWAGSLATLADRIDVVARHDPDPERGKLTAPDHVDTRLSRTLPEWTASVPFETELDRVIAQYQPDIALVTLPNREAPIAIAAMARAGIHVLVDKPAARVAHEAERAFEVARAMGVKSAVALTRRYGRGWQDVARLIASGKLGRLLATEAVFATSSVAVRDPSNALFRKREMGGGVPHWLAVHDVDTLLWLTGERIVDVQAMTAAVGDPAIDVEHVVSASVRYASGAVGTVHLAYVLPGPGGEGYVAIRGSEGSVTVQPDGAWTWTGTGSSVDPVLSPTTTYESRPSTGYGAVGAVIIDDLLHAIDAMHASAASGRRIGIDGAT